MERTHITTNMDVVEIIFSEQSVCDRLGKNLRGHISEIRTNLRRNAKGIPYVDCTDNTSN